MSAFQHSLVSALSLAAGSSLLPFTAGAQTTVATNPVGFTTLTATGGSTSAPGFTFTCLNMVRPAVYRSAIPSLGSSSSTGATVLIFPANTFTDGQFEGATNSCYVELTNGSATGLIANVTATKAADSTQNGGSTITLDQNINAVITSGATTFLVRPHWTFGTAFGASNSAGFQGDVSATNADVIQIINPSTSVGKSYYYNTTNNHWQNGFTDSTNVIIPPYSGIYVQRKVASALSFAIVGEVKLGTTGIGVVGGSSSGNSNLVPNPYPLPSVALAASNLYTGNANTGFVGDVSATNADNLGIFDSSTGKLTNYYYNTTNSRWQNGFTDASSVVIPSGASVLITRKNARPTFVWYVPQPSMNL